MSRSVRAVSPVASTGAISLRRRVYLLMAIGIAFPLLTMGAVAIFWMRTLDARFVEVRLGAATAVAAHFDAELTDDLEVLQRLAASLSALDQAGADTAEGAVRDAHHLLRHRDAVFVLDRTLKVVAEDPPGALGATRIPLAEQVLATGRPRLSGVAGGARGLVYELVAIRGWSGDVIGVVGGTFRPERRDFERMLKQLLRGETGAADLVDGDGTVVASTDRTRTGAPATCARRMVQLAQEKKAVAVVCADCHASYDVQMKPDQHLTFAPLGSAPWGVVLRQPASEALPAQGALPWWMIVWVLLGQLVLAGVFAWGSARSVTAPVAVLTDHAERIAGGELAWPIPALGSDEIGRLGVSLEKMRQNLATLIGDVAEANAQLEQRVAERTRELNEANVQLREREEDRAQLLRKVITAQEDERKRIARELHDETTQGLAVLAMGIDAAQDAYRSGKVPRLDEVKALTVRTLEDVHRLILDLRPSVLDDLGLLSAVQWYADRTLVTRGVSARCEFGEMPRLSPEMETALFRMCQEAMSNVARHAQATAVLVQVGVEDGQVVIDIEDDGKGFDREAVSRREGRRPWGLMGIRERAEILGGVATVESAPGQGTHVVVRIPLPRDPAPTEAAPGAVPEKEGMGS
jgi:signal transduction histidine kinase